MPCRHAPAHGSLATPNPRTRGDHARHRDPATRAMKVALTETVDAAGMRILREAGLVASERRGTWVWYTAQAAQRASLRAALD